MSDDSILPEITGAENALSKMDKTILKLTENTSKFLNLFRMGGGTGFGANSGFGALGLGNSGNNVMPGSLANIGSFLQMNRMSNVKMSMGIGAMQAATGIFAGAAQAMPDLQTTMGRASGFYQTALMAGMGPGGRGALASMTLKNMNGGISAMGMDATTAATFVAMGIRPGSAQFSNLTTSVSNAAKYLGMGNDVAARAMGGLTQGNMSSNLMRNFGVYTTNPVTGQRLTPTQIISQVASRITGGQKLSVEDLQTSMQGGALGVNLGQIGDPATQQLVYQYLIDQAQGKNMDLGNNTLMSRLQKEAGVNPQQSQMTLNTSNTQVQNTATDAYIAGMQAATSALVQFNNALNGFLQTPAGQAFAGINAGANTLAGSNVGQGFAAAAGGIMSGAKTVGGSLLTAAMLNKFMGGSAASSSDMGSKVMGKIGTIGKGIGYAGGGIETVIGAATGNGSMIGGGVGTILGGLAGSLLDPFIGPAGTMLGMAAGNAFGSWIGGSVQGSGRTGGDGSTVGSGTSTDTSKSLKLIKPVKGKVTLQYGVKDKNHPTGHNGIDYGVGMGTPVKAAADGKVKSVGGSSANTYGTSNHSFGLCVVIDHGGGYTTTYGHLSAAQVAAATAVKQGDVIAMSGNSGYSTGPHLHFELQKNGKHTDPNTLMDGGGGSAVSGGQAGNVAGDQAGAGNTASNSVGSSGDSSSSSTSDAGWSVSGNASTPQAWSGSASGAGVGTAAVLGHGASTTSSGGSMGSGTGGGPDSGGKNNVVINLTIADASGSEARKFAKLVKEYLNEDKLMTSMGAL